jgi:hypothetical protein
LTNLDIGELQRAYDRTDVASSVGAGADRGA